MRNTVRSIRGDGQPGAELLPEGHSAHHGAIAWRRIGLPVSRRLIGVMIPLMALVQGGCATVPLVAGAEPEKPAVSAMKKRPPRCEGYVLLVENQMSRPVEIYEIGLNSERLVTVALHGITEVQMVDHSQQYVAVSQGEVMAVTGGRRSGDRVELQKNCRGFF